MPGDREWDRGLLLGECSVREDFRLSAKGAMM